MSGAGLKQRVHDGQELAGVEEEERRGLAGDEARLCLL